MTKNNIKEKRQYRTKRDRNDFGRKNWDQEAFIESWPLVSLLQKLTIFVKGQC
jgi:hypothetical protein